MSFKSKQKRDRFEKMLDTANRLKVDITQEITDLQ
jgi:dsDNA-binding SOS-regulon protein